MGSPKPKHALVSLVAGGALAASGLVGIGLATAPGAFAATPCGSPPPTLTKLTLTPGSVNVKTNSKTIKITGTTSGTPITSASLSAQAVGSTKRGSYAGLKVASGGHSFSGTMVIPKWTSKGTWHVDYVGLNTDVSSRYYSYGSFDPATDLSKMPNVKSSFTVASNPEAKKPTVSKISLAKTSVSTKSKAAKVGLTVSAKDTGGSGVAGVYVSLTSGSHSLYGYATPKKGKITGKISVPKWLGNKTFKVSYVSVSDKAGNSTTYNQTGGAGYKKLPAKFKKSLKVTSKSDTKKPTIGATSVTPGTAAVGAVAPVKLNASVKASDSQSGISYVSIMLKNQDPNAFGTEYGNLSQKAGGVWKGTISLGCYSQPGTYDVVVTAYDKAGNQITATKGSVILTAAP